MPGTRDKRALATCKSARIGLEVTRPFLREVARTNITGDNRARLDQAGQTPAPDAQIAVHDQANVAARRPVARNLSAERLVRRIRVTTIASGAIKTGIYGKTCLPPDVAAGFAQSLAKGLPVKRLASAHEIARVALFLAGDDSSFIPGEDIAVDGGWSRF